MLSRTEVEMMQKIMDAIPGWSSNPHAHFFAELVDRDYSDFLLLGVYLGRDIAMLATLLKSHGWINWRIVGVDKFDDSPCADWPEGAKTWEDSPWEPPSLEKTRANLEMVGICPLVCRGDAYQVVSLVKATAEAFLAQSECNYDCIYIDTSHDYATVKETIRLAVPRVKPGGLLCGDDLFWGEQPVQKAVRESFVRYTVFADMIWYAKPEDYKGQP